MFLSSWKRIAGVLVLAAVWVMPALASAQDEQDEMDAPALSREQASELRRTAKANDKACRRLDADACLALADAYQSGEGAKHIRGIATLLYGDACDLGNLTGCARQAEALTLGEGGVELDPERGLAIADAACRKGGDEAWYVQAQAWLTGTEISEDTRSRAYALLDSACRRGLAEACVRAATEHSYGTQANLWSEGEYWYLACLAGDPNSCSTATRYAWNGIGIEPDPDLAQYIVRRGCELTGDAECNLAGNLAREPALSAKCDSGSMPDCAELGKVMGESWPIIDDTPRKLDVLARACEAGVDTACPRAADTLWAMSPKTGTPEMARLIGLLTRACKPGDPAAQYLCVNLGSLLVDDLNQEHDYPRAAALLVPLCETEVVGACEHLPFLASEVPGIQVLTPAGTDYRPPRPDTDDASAAEPRKRVRTSGTGTICESYRERFRGKVYKDHFCHRRLRNLHGYPLKRGEAPWQALIWRPKNFGESILSAEGRVECGGTIVRTGWILTAAHCINDHGFNIAKDGHEVRLGVYNPRDNEGTSYPILRAIPHPDYDPATFAFDIALVQYDTGNGTKLGRTTPFVRLTIDPLTMTQRKITAGMDVYGYGWGWTAAEHSQTTEELRGIKMQLTSQSRCTAITKFRGVRLNSALCAGGREGQQSCSGDSGGGLVYYDDPDKVPKVIGVVSAGRACGTVGEQSRYTRVAAVRDWLEQYLGPLPSR